MTRFRRLWSRWIARRRERALFARAHREIRDREVDPRIRYPSYKALDGLIDVPRLKALDGFLNEAILRWHHDQKTVLFDTGPMKRRAIDRRQAGSRLIALTESMREFRYLDLDRPELWRRTPAADEFAPLMDFIATLPFKATARMIIMYDPLGHAVPAHRDHGEPRVCHEFIWFRTNMAKPFFMLDDRTKTKRYVESYSAWFDTHNQFHGGDPHQGLGFTIRVDGHFTDEFRAQIPKPIDFNAASTPALWAALS